MNGRVPSPSSDPGRQRLAAVVRRSGQAFDLAEAALLIATIEHADLQPAPYLALLEQMAQAVRERLGHQHSPLAVIAALSEYLFVELGFAGNAEDYYDPSNSFLNDVLDRRTGIPITLSVVYLEIAQRIGFPMAGVGMPGHFIVKYTGGPEPIYVDPFYGGVVLSPDDCERRIHDVYGDSAHLQEHFLAAVTPRQILQRILGNLKAIYLHRSDYRRALQTVEYLLTIAPWALTEVRDRGMIRYHLHDVPAALADLETYLSYSPEAEDAGLVQKNIEVLRAQDLPF